MEDLTIRGLDDETLRRLRIRAQDNQRSLEDEVRDVLRTITGNRSDWILELIRLAHDAGGADLPAPARDQRPREVLA